MTEFTADGVRLILGDCLSVMAGMEPSSVDLAFGSPPYCDARTYGINAQRNCIEWVDWMLEVTEAAARITRGPVLWVAAGVTRKRNYWPACEGLIWEWWKRGGEHQLYRPCIYHRIGIPGSGGKDWLRADTEYVLCFKRPGALAWADNTAMGHPPKWAPGGEMSYRLTDGQRRNQWGGSYDLQSMSNARTKNDKRDKTFRPSHRTHTKARADGTMEVQNYIAPVLANPGNLIQDSYTADEVASLLDEAGSVTHHIVGGGCMGDRLAHENEAPFSQALAGFFVRSFCPPGGTVLDPFSGSGTTAAVAVKHERQAI